MSEAGAHIGPLKDSPGRFAVKLDIREENCKRELANSSTPGEFMWATLYNARLHDSLANTLGILLLVSCA